MKRMKLLILITLFSLKAFCPTEKTIYIEQSEAINPYENIWRAIVAVESGGNPLAVGDKHLAEWSYGVAQIRRVRIDDFNRRTGSSYTIKDAFDVEVSREIFMWYAHQIGPYDMERIIRNWNGKWELTDNYYVKVKKVLELSN